MVGCLFRDLRTLRKLGRVASPQTRGTIRCPVEQAHELRAQSGGPVESDVPESEEVKDGSPCRGDSPALWERRRFPCGEPEGGGTPPPPVQGLREDREGGDRARDSPTRGRTAESADKPPPREPADSKAEVSALAGGRRYLQFRKAHPKAEIWLLAGLTPRAAKALAKACILSLADLRERSKEEILALRGLGHAQLRKCERLLGHELPSRPNYWVSKGLPGLAAASLGRAGLRTIGDLEGMTREQLHFLPGVGEVVLRHCEELLGHAIPSVAPYWIEQGFGPRLARALARAGLRDIRQVRELKTAELRRIGLTKANLSSVLGILPRRGASNQEDKGISDARPL